jgi:hypothetical protein
VVGALRRSPRGPRLSDELGRDPEQVVDDALRAFGTYHAHPAAVRRGERVFHEDRNLLLYYANRLKGYDLSSASAASTASAGGAAA